MNALVHFYLGFSYDGVRAWSVTLGPAPTKSKPQAAGAPVAGASVAGAPVEWEPRTSTPQTVPLPKSIVPAAEPPDDDPREFVMGALAAAERRGEELLLATLGDYLVQRFGRAASGGHFGHPTLSAFVGSIPGLEIEGSFPRQHVRRTRLEATQNQELRAEVEKYVIDWVDRMSHKGRPALASNAGWALARKFHGDPIHRRLGYRQLTDLLRDIEDLVVEGAPEIIRRATPGRSGGRTF